MKPESDRNRPARRLGRRVAILLVLSSGLLIAMSLSSQNRPPQLGVVNGRLAPCPDSPNCVGTTAASAEQQLPPWEFTGSAAAAMERIKQVLGKLPRVKIVSETDHYLHAEVRSLIFRFVDDVEFLIDAEQGKIHFRSAARVGYSDMGVNRRRMEKLSEAFRSLPD